MVDEENAGIFIVRQGEGEKATYAICHRLDTVSGDDQIPGTNKTARQFVDEQKLDAAFVSSEKYEEIQHLTAKFATGEDIFIHIEPE